MNGLPSFSSGAPSIHEDLMVTLQRLLLRADLSPNQARSPVLAAQNDLEAVSEWLAGIRDRNQNTFVSYRKEVLRFIQWGLEQSPPVLLTDMTTQHVRDYLSFVLDPQPAHRWIGPAVARTHPRWRPFTKPLSPASQELSRTILRSMFQTLMDVGYARANPFALSRRSMKRGHTGTDDDGLFDHRQVADTPLTAGRYLHEDEWELIQKALVSMPKETKEQEMMRERARFLIHFCALIGPRRSELARARMGSVARTTEGYWFWHTQGKRQKYRKVPLTEEAMSVVVRWRRFRGFPDLPSDHEAEPLVCDLTGSRALSDKRIYQIGKEVFALAATMAPTQDMAERMNRASVHWLRHTFTSRALNQHGVPLTAVREALGHADLSTTSRYAHSKDADLYLAFAQSQNNR